jgi:hypothetical protein
VGVGAGGEVSSSPAAKAKGTVSAKNVMASARLLMKKVEENMEQPP